MSTTTETPTDWTVHNAVAAPAPIKAFNAVLGVGDGKLSRRLFSLDPAGICAAARKSSGLDDLGPPTFWDGLGALTSFIVGDDAFPRHSTPKVTA